MKTCNKNIQTESVREMPKLNSQRSCLTPVTIPISNHQQQIASPYGPATSRENFSGKESLLMNNHFRASDLLPFSSVRVTPSRTRRFSSPATFSVLQMLEVGDDDVVVMDGVLVASATGKKVPKSSSDSGPCGAGGPARSSGNRNPHKNRSSQENIHPQQSAIGKGETQANSPESFADARRFTSTLRSPLGQQERSGSASSSSHIEVSYPHQLPQSPFHTIVHPYEVYASTGPNDHDRNSPLSHKLLSTGFAVPTINQRLTGTNSTPITEHETKPQIISPKNTSTTLPHTSTTASHTESSTKATNAMSQDWSPLDDGIEITVPLDDTGNEISWNDIVNQDALFNPFKYKKRLSVFSEICPDGTLPD